MTPQQTEVFLKAKMAERIAKGLATVIVREDGTIHDRYSANNERRDAFRAYHAAKGRTVYNVSGK